MSDLWHNERRLWLEGVGAYEQLMWTDCIMSFGPMGSCSDAATQQCKITAENVALLAYKANGTRDGTARPYEAICTSSYVCVDGYWWLTHHQQKPMTS